MKAFRIFSRSEARIVEMPESDLTPGEVLVRVKYSGVNFKDALAGTGQGAILKRYPLNGGIDMAGIVERSEDSRFNSGDEVLANGMELSENFDGGFAEKIRIRANALVKRPIGLTLQESMTLGTAGYTAALAIERMITNGQDPSLGPIAVTGATGGVGSFAIQILNQLGYQVTAITNKAEAFRYLKDLGAHSVVSPSELELGSRPLESVRFGGVIDNVGGELLAKLISHTQLWGNVSSIGLAASAELKTTVMPFILRGVSILGVSSNNAPMAVRQKIWSRLGDEWKPVNINKVLSKTIALEDLPQAFLDILDRKVMGRIVVVIS